MIDFSKINDMNIPEGKVVEIVAPEGVIWSKICTLTLKPYLTSFSTTANAKYTINGVEYIPPAFGDEAITLKVPIGTIIQCNLQSDDCKYDHRSAGCYVYMNGTHQAGHKINLVYSFMVFEDLEICPEIRKGYCDEDINFEECNEDYYSIFLYINDEEHYGTTITTPTIKYDYTYVSLGDSIAAGHSINYYNSGTSSQYGEYNNTSTYIVRKSYTDLIRQELYNTYGSDKVSAVSYAHSGDTVEDLMSKLDDERVINSIKSANLVTVCIGANDILVPAMDSFDDYIINGQKTLDSLSTTVAGNITNLGNDSYEYSYRKLFEKLNTINSSAQYIFTTVYNPYKHLHLAEGTNGFFKPLLDTIPDLNGIGDYIREGLLDIDAVETLFDRTNAISAWTETHINELNNVLRNALGRYNRSNFYLAETKELFDEYTTGEEYSNLVNVEFHKDLDVSEVHWGQLKGSQSWFVYWSRLVVKHTISGFDINSFAEDLIEQVIEEVILPDTDPHPKKDGHKVIYDAFAEHINLEQEVKL